MLARSMSFEFHRPVYVDERVSCAVVESVEREEGRAGLEASFECWNDADEVVLSGTFAGVVFAPSGS